jgi:anti-sigma B factor antagonist
VSLDLESQVAGVTARVVLRGDVDMATAPELRRVLDELVDGGATEIVLDCRGLDFLDSSGIGALVSARARLGDTGQLVLEAARPNVQKVLAVTGVDQELTLRD